MNKALISPLIIGVLSSISLGMVWYETIFQWTLEDNMKFYVENQCYRPDVFCESQPILMQITLFGIFALGMLITMFCYARFTLEPDIAE